MDSWKYVVMGRMRIKKVVFLFFVVSYLCMFFFIVNVILTDQSTTDKRVMEIKLSHLKFGKMDSSKKVKRLEKSGSINNGTVIKITDRLSLKQGNKSVERTDRNRIGNEKQNLNNLEGSIYSPLNYIPTVRLRSKPYILPYLNKNITDKFLTLPDMNFTHQVAIVSPIRNAEKALDTFRRQLQKLSYPHHLLSMYFGESGSTDKTFEKAYNISVELRQVYHFTDTRIVNLGVAGGIHGDQNLRHKKEYQRYRRAVLAVTRNRLVQYALKQRHFDYVLTIDSDIEELPDDLVQQMLFAKSDIVVASCLRRIGEHKYMYDFNCWRETSASLQSQGSLKQDDLVLEGYGPSFRKFLPWLRHEGRVVKLDGVGGCALMVKADCFRSGLQFPETVYKHHIETEGLAKMGLDMGYSVVGLPFVEVFHPHRN